MATGESNFNEVIKGRKKRQESPCKTSSEKEDREDVDVGLLPDNKPFGREKQRLRRRNRYRELAKNKDSDEEEERQNRGKTTEGNQVPFVLTRKSPKCTLRRRKRMEPMPTSFDEVARDIQAQDSPGADGDNAVAGVDNGGQSNDWSETVLEHHDHMCAVCYDVMARPLKLRPCGHVFCELCLRHLQDANEKRLGLHFRTTKINIHVECPVCRQIIQKCELHSDLDSIIRERYPQRYRDMLRQLNTLTSSNRRSKVPSYTGKPPNPTTIHRPRPAPPRPPVNILLALKKAFPFMIWALCIGVYYTTMFVAAGLWHFGSTLVVRMIDTSPSLSIWCRNLVRRFSRTRWNFLAGTTFEQRLRILAFVKFCIDAKLFLDLPFLIFIALSLFMNGVAFTGFLLVNDNFDAFMRLLGLRERFIRLGD